MLNLVKKHFLNLVSNGLQIFDFFIKNLGPFRKYLVKLNNKY